MGTALSNSRRSRSSRSEGDTSQIGNRALIAAGTGLGEGLLIWNGHMHIPYPSEGGRADYSPRNEDEIDLLRFLKQKYDGRISWERVVSGMGMTNVYEFLRDVARVEEPNWLAEEIAASADPDAVITEAALAAESEICEKTLDIVISAYGPKTHGNLALKVMSVAVCMLAAGSRRASWKTNGTFLRAFQDKGRLSQLLIDRAVRVILGEPRRGAGSRCLRRSTRGRAERCFAASRVH